MRYGFVIDQRTCIGCHACTVACKEENRVPLGTFRTWVKVIERGEFPSTRRYFSVLRCNHCDSAPCVTICPTVALYRRADGIVDFDGSRCIGCKSCLHACPYDALYIDPSTHTAAKCNYCAHRVEVGLEPACVIVCPERAIIAGDLDDASSPIAQLVATQPVQVRKPEQGTKPKVFYLGADAAALTPALQRASASFAWAERPAHEVSLLQMAAAAQPEVPAVGLSRQVYDVPHLPRPWGPRVSAYLWTKAVAAGSLMVAGLVALVNGATESVLLRVAAPLVALVFLLATTALLVGDLTRPDRFHYILLKPNWRSWLVKGTWILIAHGVVASLWVVTAVQSGSVEAWVAVLGVLSAVATAGYSAFLFGQAEGRDFWQSPLLLPQLLLSAAAAGAAMLILVAFVSDLPAGRWPSDALIAALLFKGLAVVGELSGTHSSADAAQASRLITHGPFRRRFWWGMVAGGVLLPIVIVLLIPGAAPLAALLALAGLWLYEDMWVSAGQSIALS